MGLSGVSIGSLLVILLIVILLFGTKKLKTLGKDLGSAVKGLKEGLKDDETPHRRSSNNAEQSQSGSTSEHTEMPKQNNLSEEGVNVDPPQNNKPSNTRPPQE